MPTRNSAAIAGRRTGGAHGVFKFETRGMGFLLRQPSGAPRHQLADSGEVGDGADRSVGCGKSTFLRSLNRMNDMIEGAA